MDRPEWEHKSEGLFYIKETLSLYHTREARFLKVCEAYLQLERLVGSGAQGLNLLKILFLAISIEKK